MLRVECATEVVVASAAAPVSAVEDHPADGDGNERDRAEDRSGEPEEGGVVFDEWERRHHREEEHNHDELLPQPLGVGILECGCCWSVYSKGFPSRGPTDRRSADGRGNLPQRHLSRLADSIRFREGAGRSAAAPC